MCRQGLDPLFRKIRGSIAAVTVVVWAWAQIGALAHSVEAFHVYCAEHQEVHHIDHDGNARVVFTNETLASVDPNERHGEECALGTCLRERALYVAHIVVVAPIDIIPPDLNSSETTPAAAKRQLRLATKHAPPLA